MTSETVLQIFDCLLGDEPATVSAQTIRSLVADSRELRALKTQDEKAQACISLSIEELRQSARGHEGADGLFAMEANTWRSALSHIADGCSGAAQIAQTALKTEGIDFSRW